MATSGSYDWTLNRDQIITAALRKLGVLEPGATPSTSQLTYCAEQLNAMVKEWANDGVRLWTLMWTSKPLEPPSDEVTGTDGKVYTCILGHTSATASKPVTGSDWSTFWTERGSTGGVWAADTFYSSIGDEWPPADTLSVEQAFIRLDGTDYPVKIVGFGEFLDEPDKAKIGRPTRLFIDKSLPPRMALLPIPDRNDYVLHYLRVRKLEDFDDAANTGDFPERWLLATIYGLASLIGSEYRISTEVKDDIHFKAAMFYKRAKAGGREESDDSFTYPAYTP